MPTVPARDYIFVIELKYGRLKISHSSGGSLKTRASTDTQRPCSEKVSWVLLKFETWPASLALEATKMSARLYHNKRWSEEDDNLLRSMSQAGKSLTLMTVKLNRPMASIRARAEDLGLGIAGTEIGRRKRRG